MRNRSQVYYGLLHKKLTDQGSTINKVYYNKAIRYGAYLEIFEYRKVQSTYKTGRTTYERKNVSRSDFSVSRARQAIYRLCDANVGQHGPFKPIFFTLTFKKQEWDYERALDQWKYFLKKYERKNNARLKYVCIPERHKSEAFHFHGVFFNLPYIPYQEFKRMWSGSVDFSVPRGIRSVASYIAKYITKDIRGSTDVGRRMYLSSRGLYRAEESYQHFVIEEWKEQGYYKQVDFSTGEVYTFKKLKDESKTYISAPKRRKKPKGV